MMFDCINKKKESRREPINLIQNEDSSEMEHLDDFSPHVLTSSYHASEDNSESLSWNKIYLIKTPLDITPSKESVEFINEDVSYKMLFKKKYKRVLLIGCMVSMFEQLSGHNIITPLWYYFGPPDTRFEGLKFLVAGLRLILGFISIFMLSMYRRRSLFMYGFIVWWFCNGVLFLLFQEEIEYNTLFGWYLKAGLIAMIMIHTFAFSLTLGPVTWSYMAEMLPAKALGIAVSLHWIVNICIAILPYVNSKFQIFYYKELKYNEFYSYQFFVFSGLSVLGYFLVLVFLMETSHLSKEKLQNVYNAKYFDTMKDQVKKSGKILKLHINTTILLWMLD